MKKTLYLITMLCISAQLHAQSNYMTWADVTCNGDCDGSATANPFNGATPFTYLWSSNTGSQITRAATGLCPGTYSVTVTDNSSSTVTGTATVGEPSVITATFAVTDVNCSSGNDGAINLTPSGGSPNRALAFNGVNDYIAANKVADDGAGYPNGITVEAWAWPDPAWTTGDAMVMAFNDGVVADNLFLVVFNTVNDKFAYFDNTVGNLFSAGTYAPGSWYHIAVTITSGGLIRLYVNGTQQASTTTTWPWEPLVGDLFSIGQEWDNLSTTSQHWWGRIDEVRVWNAVLSAATISSNYNNCCPITSSHPYFANLVAYFSMNEGSGSNVGDRSGAGNSGLYVNGPTWVPSSQADYNCYTLGTGYMYDWSTSATIEDISNLSAATYTVSITDGNCCMVEDSATVNEPGLLGTSTVLTDVTCNGFGDGTGTVNPFGGVTPYSYQWDANTGNQTNQVATGLNPGTYLVTVTDNNGCSGVDSVTIVEPTVLTSGVTGNDALCNGESTGDAAATGAGGTSPYTYAWSSGGSTANETGLQAGWHYVTITDNNNCITIDSILISEPTLLVPSITSTTDATCNGDCDGQVIVTSSGGTSPYTYLWDDTNSQTNSTATGLCAGTYNVTVTDSNGCDSVITVSITEPVPVITGMSNDTTICEGDAATLTVVGTNTYAWSTTETTQSIIVSPVVNTTYNVVVTNGPCVDSATVTVSVDPVIAVYAGEDTTIVKGTSVQLTGTGGTNLYWWPATFLNCTNCIYPVSTPDVTTTYYLSDSANCATTDTVTVFVDDVKSIYMPNIFSPNNDGSNDVYYVRGAGLQTVDFIIYNRWGEKMFESTDIATGWDGMHNGFAVNAGVYVYLVRATYYDGKEVEQKGTITVVR